MAERRSSPARARAGGTRAPASRANGSRTTGIGEVVRTAVQEFVALSGVTPERVSGVRSTNEGWSILVDVVELERVPTTTSVMCTYRLDIDEKSHLTGFERIRRFTRAATDGR